MWLKTFVHFGKKSLSYRAVSYTFAVVSLFGLVISAFIKTVKLFLSVCAHSCSACVRLLVCQKHKKGHTLCAQCRPGITGKRESSATTARNQHSYLAYDISRKPTLLTAVLFSCCSCHRSSEIVFFVCISLKNKENGRRSIINIMLFMLMFAALSEKCLPLRMQSFSMILLFLRCAFEVEAVLLQALATCHCE